jgi:hypothetical protein
MMLPNAVLILFLVGMMPNGVLILPLGDNTLDSMMPNEGALTLMLPNAGILIFMLPIRIF